MRLQVTGASHEAALRQVPPSPALEELDEIEFSDDLPPAGDPWLLPWTAWMEDANFEHLWDEEN